MAIKFVIRFGNNSVVVFDECGEQIEEYRGRYEETKEAILRDAPVHALFTRGFAGVGVLEKVPREEW